MPFTFSKPTADHLEERPPELSAHVRIDYRIHEATDICQESDEEVGKPGDWDEYLHQEYRSNWDPTQVEGEHQS